MSEDLTDVYDEDLGEDLADDYADYDDDLVEDLDVDLKPCPFCGGKAILVHLSESDDYYVVCEDCVVYTDYRSKEKVINVWNTRVTDKN